MVTLIAIAITMWVATLLARPRRPLPGNEVAELVYARLLGRQQRLVLLALLVTAGAFLSLVVVLPRLIDPDLRDLRAARHACTYPQSGAPICPLLQPGGTWVHAVMHADGSWQEVSEATGLVTNPYDDPATLNR